MTKEEAKSFLTDISYDLGTVGIEYLSVKDGERMRDAIKALEQEPTTKNDLGVNYISKQAVLDLIADDDLSMGQVVRGIHALPSVTPQEPILDKLRAEIEQRPYGIANDSVIQGMKYERAAILKILDKYKAESEDEDETNN